MERIMKRVNPSSIVHEFMVHEFSRSIVKKDILKRNKKNRIEYILLLNLYINELFISVVRFIS